MVKAQRAQKAPMPEKTALNALFKRGQAAITEQSARGMIHRYPQEEFGWKVLGVVLQQQGKLGDAGFMTGNQGGNDVLIGGALAANNVLFGEAEIMTGSRGGNDVLIGGGGCPVQHPLRRCIGYARQ